MNGFHYSTAGWMEKKHRVTNKAPVAQRGIVLVVGLILLFLVTLVALAGMRDTLLQERMAGNARDRDLARQAAEAALRNAESTLKAMPWGPTMTSISAGTGMIIMSQDGSSLSRNIGGNIVSETQYWTDPNSTAWNSSLTYSGGNTVVAQPAQYVIEQMPYNTGQLPGSANMNYDSAGALHDTSGDPLYYVSAPSFIVVNFLITAKGYGQTTDTQVVLQSQYRIVICLLPQGSGCNMAGTCAHAGFNYPQCY